MLVSVTLRKTMMLEAENSERAIQMALRDAKKHGDIPSYWSEIEAYSNKGTHSESNTKMYTKE